MVLLEDRARGKLGGSLMDNQRGSWKNNWMCRSWSNWRREEEEEEDILEGLGFPPLDLEAPYLPVRSSSRLLHLLGHHVHQPFSGRRGLFALKSKTPPIQFRFVELMNEVGRGNRESGRN